MASKIRKGDEVVVLIGKDRGKRGVVTKILTEQDRVVVENINIVKKHQRPNPNLGVAGGIIDIEMSIHVSNVAIYNPATGKPDRVGFKTLQDGRKVRILKSNNEVLDT
jgi:large subunit ribosomal protein L24